MSREHSQVSGRCHFDQTEPLYMAGETNGAGIHLLDGLRKASWRGLEGHQFENSVPKTEYGTNVGPTRLPFPFSREWSGRSYRRAVPHQGFDVAPHGLDPLWIGALGRIAGRPFLADRSMSGCRMPRDGPHAKLPQQHGTRAHGIQPPSERSNRP